MKWTRIEGERTICRGHIMNILERTVVDGDLVVENGRIADIRPVEGIPADAPYYLPGFVDSHVHIESSMMVPVEFARIALQHGTIGVIADPHEIANVMGEEGIDFMIRSGEKALFHFAFGAPSCVPSCNPALETSGTTLDAASIARLMARPDIHFLGEMMNFPGILSGDAETMAKVQAALDCGKPVDGHAPGVLGDDRRRYAEAGITTDHECSTLDEARSCIQHGMKVLIREGSAAKNFEALAPLIAESPDSVMFCTDDCHPNDLIYGHLDRMVRRAITLDYDLWDILQIACVNPVQHYRQPWGLLRVGDPADFVSLTDITPNFRVRKVYIGGEKAYSYNNLAMSIASQQQSLDSQKSMLYDYPNHFLAHSIQPADIATNLKPGDTVRIIRAYDGSLLTGMEEVRLTGDPFVDAQSRWDEIQKIVVLNRHVADAKPQVGFIRGFNLKNGAMAASIAHDCHNIVAIGTNDALLCQAINRVVEMRGGIVAISGTEMTDLPLPIAGLISPLSGHEIAFRSSLLEHTVRKAGCTFASPFITMAFLCLPVIPKLKISDKGLIDGETFQIVQSVF